MSCSRKKAERFFERLERELSLGRHDWPVNARSSAGDRFQNAFALTRGGGR
jgi:hypothetical protein